ncbi:MAG: glycoside hydrolase family 127 protein, partial [Prevotella sp.]|nr:glycoside hydrolase family 127 protein [Prevotella sp.]
MKKTTAIIFAATVLAANSATAQNHNYGYPYTPVAFTSVKIAPNTFWGDRIKAAREVTIPLAFSKCESEGRYANFVKAAHPSDSY